MQRPRYYPTSVRRETGDIIIVGHTGVSPAGLGTERTRDELTLGPSPAFEPLRENWGFADATPCNEPPDPEKLDIWDYAKVYVLSSGQLMWVDGQARAPMGGLAHVSWFQSLVFQDCPSSSEPFRWRDGVLPNPLHPAHAAGDAAHYVLHDVLGQPYDVVYLTGGVPHGEDDSNACPVDAQGNPIPILNLVEKMVVPDETASWDQVASLRRTRFNADGVILLNGSFWIDGGHGRDAAGNCVERTRSELYEPPEVFGPDADTQWRLMATEQKGRGYHSVAGLLPSGQAFTAGGQDSPHTAEIFNPPYLFKTPRPVIENAPATIEYNTPLPQNTNVGLHGSQSVDRVALLSPSSYTHTVAFDQRYVDLRFTTISGPSGTPPQQIINIVGPENGFVAPPGYYLLTVIDTNDIPSVAAFVQVVQ